MWIHKIQGFLYLFTRNPKEQKTIDYVRARIAEARKQDRDNLLSFVRGMIEDKDEKDDWDMGYICAMKTMIETIEGNYGSMDRD